MIALPIEGGATIVDADVAAQLGDLPWRVDLNGYVCAWTGAALLYLSREVMGAERGQVVDHINGDKLDNRRSNLRVCSHQQNTRNRRRPINNTSGFKGVRQTLEGTWRATVTVDGKPVGLGAYRTAVAAAVAYDRAAAVAA